MSEPARTYNQSHSPRKYVAGRRRVSVYIAWSYPGEANRDVTQMDNRFSTMTEVRRVLWPQYETPRFADPGMFQQGIAGSLELFFWAWVRFQNVIEQTTGHRVPVFQRVDQAGFRLPLDERVLADVDTLLVFGLDHVVTGQEASAEEIESVRAFLAREGTCLVIGPHHDVGGSQDLEERAMEYAHHGDALVPRQQRFGLYTRSLMRGLGIPIENRFGLRPAVQRGTQRIAPLDVARDLDARGWLAGVTNFNFHMHLPHYAVTDPASSARVLARQPIDTSKPHPFTAAGNTTFNALVWLPPGGERAGDVLVADSTIFSTLFGGDESLERFWRNLATASVRA
ncbi:hypothetical protein [Sandaracinus amylolyticus]|uniref:hypothetical protein n=1 Tax=Sandaracinus amylolyticus TaxID=927083 RepID=UPI001969CF5B|nr:hypothetical protein [Sandaracinus amylolyticus]